MGFAAYIANISNSIAPGTHRGPLMQSVDRTANHRSISDQYLLVVRTAVREHRELATQQASQCVFATDYPQAVRDDDAVAAYVRAVRALGAEARAVLDGANVEKLIPDLRERRKARAA